MDEGEAGNLLDAAADNSENKPSYKEAKAPWSNHSPKIKKVFLICLARK